MAFPIEYATEADAPALAHVNILSFQTRGLLFEVFPDASQARLMDYKAVYAMKHFANPQTHVLKLNDPTSGELIGYGRWHIPESLAGHSLPALSEQNQEAARDPTVFAPRPMNEALYTAFRELLEGARKRHTTEQDMMLDLLATLPSHQGRGYGTAMLRWGMSKADAWQRRIYLEATAAGYPLYLKLGWKPVEEISLDFTQYGAKGLDTFVIMIRDPVPNQ
ncbi:uncharacterized protein N7459_008919 [Penicillium hispanicum]|uniref:uncharacterized protein n=1 Tax=Penicillium hispanicum TaxID=1080232 RepID=UPI00253FE8A9|nr:uncharacterized protein N7459_008919 [Penicillium hispanicum]KAJ5569489.1 hypothetical protein N7459_008919 [Penicillium hispanicum]